MTLDRACYFVNRLYELYHKDGWRQLLPGVSATLDNSIAVLENENYLDDSIKETLNNARFLKRHMYGIKFIKNTL